MAPRKVSTSEIMSRISEPVAEIMSRVSEPVEMDSPVDKEQLLESDQVPG